MSAFNRSLLNKEYILMNVLKALASIISMCNLHVTLLSKITPRYFKQFTNGIFRPFKVRGESGGLLVQFNSVSWVALSKSMEWKNVSGS
jgi:hypothetical protein